MRTKQVLKHIIDILMMLALLCLMAYQVTGETLHEWIGIGMTAILIVHHILNIKWYGALFKGKYNAYRIISTVTNTLLLASIALTAFCGMSMSSHAVPFLYGMADIVFARTAHLAMSFWSFILMGFHLGLHLPTITARVKPTKAVKIVCTAAFTALAGVGLWLFIKNGIPDYIFFRTHFAFFDYEKAAVLVFLENFAIEFFFTFLGANIVRFICSLNRKIEPKKNPLIPVVCVLLSLLIGIIPTLITAKNSATPGWDVPDNIPSDSTDEGVNAMNPEDANDGFILINGGMSTVGFADSASVSGGRIPMKLSKPVNEECNVYYTVWDYDSGSVLREGTLHFDRFETEKCIYTGENENNILIEISGVQNIARGKNCFHYLKQD